MDVIEKIMNVLGKHDSYPEFHGEYVEPGYETDKGIFTADWNPVPNKFVDWIESQGYSIEWLDEWTTCGDCGKLVRTQPDCYSWTASYAIISDCELVCHECLIEEPETYIEELINNHNKVNTIDGLDLTDHGFDNMNGVFETGLHEHMNDSPKEILKEYMEKFPCYEFVFTNFGASQFYVDYEIWGRPKED